MADKDSITGQAAETDPDAAIIDGDAGEAVIDRRRRERAKMRASMRAASILTPGFLFMNGLSAVIASYGLLADSPAVVIGAMIVAMLLGPIMGVALGLSSGARDVFIRAIISLTSGIAVVYAVAAFIGWLHGEAPLTEEILSRTSPTIYDLMIALAGGAAGAYATVARRMSAGFVGVAIATALVPPLAASGILLTRGAYNDALGAGMLALTNIAAIQFSAAVVLWLHGFARDDDGDLTTVWEFIRRHTVSAAVILALGIWSAANLERTSSAQRFEAQSIEALEAYLLRLDGASLAGVKIAERGGTLVSAVMQGPVAPSVEDLRQMEAALPDTPAGARPSLRVAFVPVRILTPEGETYEQVTPLSEDAVETSQ
ncbi:TIGR00341 family protein [Paracoccus xiamenensis]|uniref:TIGR00341 family protein n=1 Tax=Paracoccus xiamenensis TaxID=2714901 RepID=UPI001409ACBB|nr:TIGR00341 family protein [Paracoccus xiamenensis]NHF72819.1 TIGR00341 family protein [Paracoccus xiamenensis]